MTSRLQNLASGAPRRHMVFLILLSASVYAYSLFTGFAYDDNYNVLANAWITDAGHIRDIFTRQSWAFTPGAQSNYYRPGLHLALLPQYAVFGTSAWGYHLVNIVIHALNSLLVYLVAVEVAGRQQTLLQSEVQCAALFAASVFAVHPAHVEAVAWISAVTELLYSFFFLLALYIYVKFSMQERRGPLLLALSAASFAVSLLFKEPALMLVPALFAFDLAFRRSLARRGALRAVGYACFIVIAIGFLYIRTSVLGGLAPSQQHAYLGLGGYAVNIIALVAGYIRLFFAPYGLNAYHSFHPALSVVEPAVIYSIAGIVVFIVAFVWLRPGRAGVFALAMSVFPLLPALYIPALAGGMAFAERYLYLPSAGLSILAAVWLWRLRARLSGHRAFVVALVAIVALFSALTFHRTLAWKNDYTLWSDTAEKTKDSALVYTNLGAAADALGKRDEAVAAYKSALELKPYSTEVMNNLGIIYFETGRVEEAIASYKKAYALASSLYQEGAILKNLGDAYMAKGDALTALDQYTWSIEKIGESAEVRYRIGLALARINRRGEAADEFKRAIELDPGHDKAAYELNALTSP